MEEEKKKSSTVIDVVEKHIPLPLPPAVAARAIRSVRQEPKHPPSRLKLHLALIVAQACFAGYEVLLRRSLKNGTSIIVFSFYKNCLGFVVLRLLSSFLEKKNKPVLNFPALFATFLLGIFGVSVSELCYLQGLKYTAPTFASAMQNVIPVFTFILAMIFRMEKVDVERMHGLAKLCGSILLICGWMLLLVYKGERLLSSHFSFLPHGETALRKDAQHSMNLGALHLEFDNQQYGIIFLVISCLSSSVFLILQAFIMEKYAEPISFASFAFFFAIIQVGVVAAIHIHHRSTWSKFTIADGINIAYAGVIGSTAFGIQSWGVKQGGPMIVAAYQPLETITTIFLAFFLLRENLDLGSVIGGGIILLGVYLMLWGKEREQRFDARCVVQDFHGMSSTNTELPSDFSFGVITENGLASSTKSVTEPDQNLDDEESSKPWYSKIRPPHSNGEVRLGEALSMEKNAAWVFTQPLFAQDESVVHPEGEASHELTMDERNRSLQLSRPLSRSKSLNSGDQIVAPPPLPLEESQLSPPAAEDNDDAGSDTSTEMASTRSNFSRWNSGRTAASVRSIPSRMSNFSNFSNFSSAGPSRVNSVRSAASRLNSSRSNISDSSTDSEQLNSSRTSTSSD